MRTIIRAGLVTGGIGFVALFALAPLVGLVVALGVVVAGGVAGLCAAKWLERSWYGRQWQAGLRVGVVAVGLSGVGALLGLLTLAPRADGLLARRSHLVGVDLAGWAQGLRGLGWGGTEALSVALAALVGVPLAALVAWVFAWDKSKQATRVITLAREAALRLSQQDAAVASPSGRMTGAPYSPTEVTGAFGGVGGASGRLRTGAPLRMLDGLSGEYQARRQALTPSAQADAQGGAAAPEGYEAVETQALTEPTLPSAPMEQQGGVSRTPSKARPAEQQLSDDMRKALATWASEARDAQTPDERNTAQPSAYLNSPTPPPAKRNRKKQQTRDWLC